MKIRELIDILEQYDRQQTIRFSVDDASKPLDDPLDQDRIFCERGVADHWEDGHEVTLCLVGKSNRSQ